MWPMKNPQLFTVGGGMEWSSGSGRKWAAQACDGGGLGWRSMRSGEECGLVKSRGGSSRESCPGMPPLVALPCLHCSILRISSTCMLPPLPCRVRVPLPRASCSLVRQVRCSLWEQAGRQAGDTLHRRASMHEPCAPALPALPRRLPASITVGASLRATTHTRGPKPTRVAAQQTPHISAAFSAATNLPVMIAQTDSQARARRCWARPLPPTSLPSSSPSPPPPWSRSGWGRGRSW